ncbi:hypothetical protein CVT26_006278 [Gymnopilus dilepis]|uniref:Uncharacterized protein n=1 Tax=Gymnopilus dilepis TaxID=231916 RepID=A0A409VYP7_9AGAR|nr:hypothetical protein CVT26_006278 [Gymnopilus dilepis]
MYDFYTPVSNPSRDLANHISLEPNTFSWLLEIIESSIFGIVGEAGLLWVSSPENTTTY